MYLEHEGSPSDRISWEAVVQSIELGIDVRLFGNVYSSLLSSNFVFNNVLRLTFMNSSNAVCESF